MGLYSDWCDCADDTSGGRHLWLLTEKAHGREVVWALLLERVRGHYDDLQRIAEDAARLGFAKAAEILSTRVPTDAKARSGDLGEILASELAEQMLGFRIPVRRLRFKDGRNMALRGDDFIGVIVNEDGQLRLLKGESKSRVELTKTAITEAREALTRDDGRCTPESLLFVADRLLESADDLDQELGRALRDEVGQKSLSPKRIDHMLFTLSGNAPPPSLKEDLDTAPGDRNQYSTNLRIADHGEFIGKVYVEAVKLGNS